MDEERLLGHVSERTSVSNIQRELYRHACVDTAIYIRTRDDLMKAEQMGGRMALLNWALIQCRKHDGLALEFGVGEGDTLKVIANHRKVIGFDSFEGLPEDWRSGFPKGTFDHARYAIPELEKIENAELRIGLFEKSLPEFIRQNRDMLNSFGIAFIHIDSDLYSSAIDILYRLAPWITMQDHPVHILFDEFWNYPGWENGEFRAWSEFAPQAGWEYLAYDYLGEGAVIRINEI